MICVSQEFVIDLLLFVVGSLPAMSFLGETTKFPSIFLTSHADLPRCSVKTLGDITMNKNKDIMGYYPLVI